jgi:hypothetical protein
VATWGKIDLRDAIFRVEGSRVATHPDAAGPRDIRMQHGLGAGGAFAHAPGAPY